MRSASEDDVRVSWRGARVAGAMAGAQVRQRAPHRHSRRDTGPTDPRVGLKGGLTDAAFAAKGLELVANLPKPEGFIDPSGQHSLNFANSDLAFQGNHVFLGNFQPASTSTTSRTRASRAW